MGMYWAENTMLLKLYWAENTMLLTCCLCPSAVGLYWAERQSEMEKWQHNVADLAVNAAVLADLQQKQEVDFARCLEDMAGKVSSQKPLSGF